MNQAIVTVVIPTRNRPKLLERAINSVLKQSFKSFEILVIIDGNDVVTKTMIEELNDPRIRYIMNIVSVGGGQARNIGVENAKGEWIAFLDDDDEFLPDKLHKQYSKVLESTSKYPIGYCKIIARSPKKDYIWPRREMRKNEHLGDYILSRETLFQGEGLIQTTMIFAPKELLVKVPFGSNLKRHQEWDWLIRVANSKEDIEFVFANEVLGIWYIEEERESISAQKGWEFSYKWINNYLVEGKVTKRAYASFLMTVVAGIAVKENEKKAFLYLLKSAIKKGQTKLIDFILYFGIWIIPVNSRRMIRKLLSR